MWILRPVRCELSAIADEQRIAAPLHAIGSELDVEHRAGCGGCDLIDQRDVVFRLQRRTRDDRFDLAPRFRSADAARIGSDGP